MSSNMSSNLKRYAQLISDFEFDLGDIVRDRNKPDMGFIRGRAEYDNAENSYLIRYVSETGRIMELWLEESKLLLIRSRAPDNGEQ